MAEFRSFIEAKLRFHRGNDEDWPGRNIAPGGNMAVAVPPGGKYIEIGKTHGAASHAIKHMKEIDPEFWGRIVKRTVSAIGELYKSGNVDFVDKRGNMWRQFDDIGEAQAADCLDAYNDVLENDEERPPEMDQAMRPILDDLANRYVGRILQMMDEAEDADKPLYSFNELDTIRYIGRERNGKDGMVVIYADLADGLVAIGDGAAFRTMHKVTVADPLRYVINNHPPTNRRTYSILMQHAK